MKNSFWFGFLEAGKKSSLVARDTTLDTGNPQTIYLFNQAQGQIKEYKLEIVGPKLRELNADETKAQKTLEKEFTAALAQFRGRTSGAAKIPEQKASAESNKRNKNVEEELVSDVDGFDGDDDADWDDDDNN